MLNAFTKFSIAATFASSICSAAEIKTEQATNATRVANQNILQTLDFNNKDDFELANRGFIATLSDPIIRNKEGKEVYNLTALDFVKDKPSPDTANPSLWRQSQLTRVNGLFKVTDKIYQVRGFDLSNMTLIEGKSGWIVIDPLISTETAAAALKLANEKLGQRPVKALIYTHSHVDHFGGAAGVISEADAKSKKIQVIAPEGFVEEAISENLYAGNAMSRRAQYMYGSPLKRNETGTLGTGLGPLGSSGTTSFIAPNKIIKKSGEKLTVDGIEIVFQMAPGTEAPSEMLFYFPQMKALCLSEDSTSTMHNLYTLRGAKVRSPLVWSNALQTTLDMFGDKAEVSFASHHWPRWGRVKVKEHLAKQRDMYRYINDQTLRLANKGYNAEEIAERIKLPDNLAKEFYNRGYYGSLNHNVKATYQLYLGFYDANPATLYQHPRTVTAKPYVDAMGGADKVLKLGKEAFDKGDYRWAAELVNHVVYSDPSNKKARELQAAALEQIGYQSEAGPWRNVYLSGAAELRGQPNFPALPLVNPLSLPLAQLVDYTGIRIDPSKAKNRTLKIGLNMTDTNEKQILVLENSVLSLRKPNASEKIDANYTMKTADLAAILSGSKSAGSYKSIGELAGLLDNFDPAFNIITPVDEKSNKDDRMARAEQ